MQDNSLYAVIMLHGNDYYALWLRASSEGSARFRAYDRDRLGSIVLVSKVEA